LWIYIQRTVETTDGVVQWYEKTSLNEHGYEDFVCGYKLVNKKTFLFCRIEEFRKVVLGWTFLWIIIEHIVKIDYIISYNHCSHLEIPI